MLLSFISLRCHNRFMVLDMTLSVRVYLRKVDPFWCFQVSLQYYCIMLGVMCKHQQMQLDDVMLFSTCFIYIYIYFFSHCFGSLLLFWSAFWSDKIIEAYTACFMRNFAQNRKPYLVSFTCVSVIAISIELYMTYVYI